MRLDTILRAVAATAATAALAAAAAGTHTYLEEANARTVVEQRTAAHTDAQAAADALAAEHGITIVWTNNPDLNCGAAESAVGVGGCYRTETPDRIYISPNATTTAIPYFARHELAHAAQHAEGAPLDECDADARAAEAGADTTQSPYICNPEGHTR